MIKAMVITVASSVFAGGCAFICLMAKKAAHFMCPVRN